MILQCKAPLGDTLMLSPIVQQMWEEGLPVGLELKHSDIYIYDPRIKRQFMPDEPVVKINYMPQEERDKGVHYIDWFAKCVGITLKNRDLSIWICKKNDRIDFPLQEKQPTIAVCTGAGTPTRRYNKYEQVCILLKKAGWRIVEIGTSGFGEVLRTKDISYLDKLTVRQTAFTVACCDAFLGADSLCCHLAAAVDIPAYTIFSTENPDLLRHRQTIPIVAQKCTECYKIWDRKHCKKDQADSEFMSCLDIDPELIANLIIEKKYTGTYWK